MTSSSSTADRVAGGVLVFPGGRSGGPLRAPVFRASAFTAAAAGIGRPRLHPHELRHTAASLAIASGADVKVVQQMLGHASAAMTLDRYGHLVGDRLDEVADRMAAARAAAVARVLPEARIVDLGEARLPPVLAFPVPGRAHAVPAVPRTQGRGRDTERPGDSGDRPAHLLAGLRSPRRHPRIIPPATLA
jgi:hypothetical protein